MDAADKKVVLPFSEHPAAIIGREGEEMIAGLLRHRGWYVIPSYRYTGPGEGMAPIITGAEFSFAIPDLDVSKNGIRRWVEVKTELVSFTNKITNNWELRIKKNSCLSYQRVQQITGSRVWVFVWRKHNGMILHAMLDDIMEAGREYCTQDGINLISAERKIFRRL